MSVVVRIRRTRFDSALVWLLAASALITSAVGLSRGLGLEWTWATSAGLVIGALVAAMKNVAVIRDHRRDRDQARHDLLAVMYPRHTGAHSEHRPVQGRGLPICGGRYLRPCGQACSLCCSKYRRTASGEDRRACDARRWPLSCLWGSQVRQVSHPLGGTRR
jgi:hypothetical protein